MTTHPKPEDLRAMVAAATPEPWWVDGPPWNRIVWNDSETRVCFMAHSNGLNDDRDIVTSELIAQAPQLALGYADALDEIVRLRDFVAEFAAAKIEALRYSPPPGASPEDEPDPVTDAETVWAWQKDARAALEAKP